MKVIHYLSTSNLKYSRFFGGLRHVFVIQSSAKEHRFPITGPEFFHYLVITE